MTCKWHFRLTFIWSLRYKNIGSILKPTHIISNHHQGLRSTEKRQCEMLRLVPLHKASPRYAGAHLAVQGLILLRGSSFHCTRPLPATRGLVSRCGLPSVRGLAPLCGALLRFEELC
jgi:hypothetical protein